MKDFRRIVTLKKELNYKQCKTFFKSLKKESKKNYYSDLIDSDKYNTKKTWVVIKEIIGNKRVANVPLPNFIIVRNREIFEKKEIAETFNNYFSNIGPNLVLPIFPKAKRNSKNGVPKLYSLRWPLPQYHHSYGLRTAKCICEPQNKQYFRAWWYICRYCQKSVRWNICHSETYFQYLFS